MLQPSWCRISDSIRGRINVRWIDCNLRELIEVEYIYLLKSTLRLRRSSASDVRGTLFNYLSGAAACFDLFSASMFISGSKQKERTPRYTKIANHDAHFRAWTHESADRL